MLLLAFFRGSKGCGCRCLAGCNGLLWMKVRPTSAPSAQRVPAKPQLFWALRPEDVPNLQGKGTKPARSSGAYAHDPTSWLIHRTGWMGIWGFAVLGGCLISPGITLRHREGHLCVAAFEADQRRRQAHLDSGTCPALMLLPPTWSLMVPCCFQSLLCGYIDDSWGISIQISSGYTEANGATTECAVSSRLCRV